VARPDPAICVKRGETEQQVGDERRGRRHLAGRSSHALRRRKFSHRKPFRARSARTAAHRGICGQTCFVNWGRHELRPVAMDAPSRDESQPGSGPSLEYARERSKCIPLATHAIDAVGKTRLHWSAPRRTAFSAVGHRPGPHRGSAGHTGVVTQRVAQPDRLAVDQGRAPPEPNGANIMRCIGLRRRQWVRAAGKALG